MSSLQIANCDVKIKMKRNGTTEHIIPANDLNDKNNNIDLRICESRDILRVGQLGTVAYLGTLLF